MAEIDNETALSVIASLQARLDAVSDWANRWKGHPLADGVHSALNGYVHTRDRAQPSPASPDTEGGADRG